MIPLSVPNISGNEWKYIKECLDTNWVSSVGSYVNRFEKKVAEFTGAKYAVSTSNGTAALHTSLELAGVNSCHHVIVPNITFIASVNSIRYTGASPILMDVSEDNWQIDIELLKTFLLKSTVIKNRECVLKSTGRVIKAIMPVHVLGNMCDMDKLLEISEKHRLIIIEDSTEALGSFYKKKHSGTFGLFGTFSFNGNKIITTGGGGILITNDEKLGKLAKHITTQAKASPEEYYHDQIGYNYRLVNILAAMGVAQMELLPGFLERKKEIKDIYHTHLNCIKGINFPHSVDDADPNNWLLTISTKRKKELMKLLKENEIEGRPLWVPMNELPMFKNELYISGSNISKKLYDTCVSLPCSTNIKNEDIEKVISVVKCLKHE